jgi:serine/threonine protein kinase
VNKEVMPGTIIKCINITEENFETGFARVVKEFCLLKVAAILKVGPQLSNLFGFDIVVFKDCAEFCMEQCRPIYEFSAAMMWALKLKLRSLHCLNIVHLDIKPDNISFSPFLNEPILLDFGLSDVV